MTQFRKTRRPALALIAALACAGCATTSTAHTGRRGKALRTAGAGGKFAEYLWHGPVRSIHAEWKVPFVRRDSKPGKASTWIGAQGPGSASEGPFIQIGTREERNPAREAIAGISDLYRAFWSDTRHHFHPVDLFPVIPGDTISATMTLTGGRWQLQITDVNNNLSKRFATSQEATGSFNLAEWTQEDVTNGETNRPFPYPRLTPVRIDHLLVNSVAPTYASLYSTWMSTARGYLAPTSLTGDGFTVKPSRLTASGARYLAMIMPEDRIAYRFNEQLDGWNAHTTRATRAAETRRYIDGFVKLDAALKRRRWPASATALIGQLVRENGYLVSHLRALHNPTAASLTALLAEANPFGDPRVTSHMARRALHVPEEPRIR